jgi:hypothetical protein
VSPRWRVVEINAEGDERCFPAQSEAKARALFARLELGRDTLNPYNTVNILLQIHESIGFTVGLRERKRWTTIEEKP